MIKVLFLDIDGVANCAKTTQRSRGFIGIDPYMAFLIGKIVLDTGCKVVLSSSWRHFDGGVEEIKSQICEIFDITGIEPYDDKLPPGAENCQRGREIKAWLDKWNSNTFEAYAAGKGKEKVMPHILNERVEKYAILDDDSDILPEQMKNFFKTSWQTGITKEIAEAVTEHLR